MLKAEETTIRGENVTSVRIVDSAGPDPDPITPRQTVKLDRDVVGDRRTASHS